MAAPTIGATQKSQSCSIAQPPTKSAGPVLRAGFTDVLVTGMLIEMDQRERQADRHAGEATGARVCVAPRMTIRNMNVITTSVTMPATSEYLPGECSP